MMNEEEAQMGLSGCRFFRLFMFEPQGATGVQGVFRNEKVDRVQHDSSRITLRGVWHVAESKGIQFSRTLQFSHPTTLQVLVQPRVARIRVSVTVEHERAALIGGVADDRDDS